MKVALRYVLHLSVAGALLLGIACSKDKSEDVNCDAMIADINLAVSGHFSGLAIFDCRNAGECSTYTYQTTCYHGCTTTVLSAKKDALAAFLGGTEVTAICDSYQAKGCAAIVDDCPS